MKKILLFIFMIFILPISVNANDIFNIDIDVTLDKNGDAFITENWVVDGSDGTEWYKVLNNLGNINLSNFTVSMDGKPLTYKNWDINESLNQKSGYYGINYVLVNMIIIDILLLLIINYLILYLTLVIVN